MTHLSFCSSLPDHARTAAGELATRHRKAEREFLAVQRAAWEHYRGEVARSDVSVPDLARRAMLATESLQVTREAAVPTASAQYDAIRCTVKAAVNQGRLDLFRRAANEVLREIATHTAAEWTDYGMRLCDGSYVSVGARVTRSGNPIRDSAELFRHFPPGDPRKPRADRLR